MNFAGTFLSSSCTLAGSRVTQKRAHVPVNAKNYVAHLTVDGPEKRRPLRESPAWFRRCCGRSVGRLHFGRIHPVRLEGPHAVSLHDFLALAHREMPHLLGTETKLPAFIACNFASSKVSPVPTNKVPFSTVMFSSVGCQCAGIFAPSAHRRRKTKGAPFAFRSPSSEARSHPLMSDVHFKSSKSTIL
jgi:hypothetical protein